MYAQREVFPNAPLELVAAEVRYPYAPRLRKQEVIDAILEEIAGDLPVLRKQQQVTLTFPSGGVSQQDEFPRFLNLASNRSAMVTPTVLTVETTDYTDFSEFRDLAVKVVQAVAKHGSVPAVERVGLRYVDEIRVPDKIDDARDWRNWISDKLLDMTDVPGDYKARTAQGVVEYEVDGEEYINLLFRYAAVYGTGVVGNDPLKRKHVFSEPSPLFVLDFDCYFRPPLEEAPDFDADLISSVLDKVHVPAGMAFQSAINDRLRELFRGE